MITDVNELQTRLLKKMHDSGCEVEMGLSVWHPTRKLADELFSMEGFRIDPNSEEPNNSICAFVKGSMRIAVFFKSGDVEYLHKKIKQRREVKK